MSKYKAVVFDLGGVVLGSPFKAIEESFLTYFSVHKTDSKSYESESTKRLNNVLLSESYDNHITLIFKNVEGKVHVGKKI